MVNTIVTEDKHFNMLMSVPFPRVEVMGIDDFRDFLDSTQLYD